MRIDRVVVDASPLIALFKSGLAELLPQLFSEPEDLLVKYLMRLRLVCYSYPI